MRCSVLLAIAALALPFATAVAAAPVFTPGNLVVSVEGNGVFGAMSGPYGDNQASPMTLFQYTPSGTSAAAYAGSLVLPQAASGGNYAFSAEYGSSSEGLLHLSGNGAYLTVAGYGINAATFNANPALYGTGINDPSKPTALAQSGSLTGQGYIPIPRVVALIDANGVVDTTTALFDVFNGNNPRSVYSVDGSAFYVSGQGHSPDATGGVVYAAKGATTATPVTGNDTSGKTASQDTRDVQVYNGQLYVSTDSKEGSGSNRDFVGTLGTAAALPTGLANNGNGPAMLPGFGNSGGTGKLVITAATSNGVNAAAQEINLSPESFFFANATTLYVADSGLPKNDSALNDGNGSRLGDGGLQKWVLSGGRWSLAYTLSAGLGLVANTATAGVTGLLGLTGQVTNGSVNLYATSYTIGDTDQSYLYGITDLLAATSRPFGETFATLAAAPADSTFKGVAFAPIASATAVPEPSSWAMTIVGIGLAGCVFRRRRTSSMLRSA